MNAWNPPSSIAPNTYVQFYAEWEDEEPIHNWLDDSASATYVIEGNSSFKMTLKLTVTGVTGLSSSNPNYEGGYGLLVECTDPPSGLFVFPPPDTNGNSPVGWIHNGVVTVGLASFPGATQSAISPYPTPNGGDGVTWYYDLTALRPSVQNWAANWMKQYAPCIGNLQLTQLTLPGTHDAGTYPGAQVLTDQTQYLSILQQLQEGVRALDLYFQVDGTGPDRFYVSHTVQINLTLQQVLAQVQQFLTENSQEVIILDFHRFENTWANQDFYDFANTITNTLGNLVIPFPGSNPVPTLNSIWGTPGRVVVGMGMYSGGAMTSQIVTWLQSNTKFWINAVQQMWCGTSTTEWSTVASYMDSVLSGTTAPWNRLWALMAQYNLAINADEPAYVPEELSTYFATGTNGLKANIIHCDWWDRINSGTFQLISELNIPNFSTLINAVPYNMLKKGYRLANNLPLW